MEETMVMELNATLERLAAAAEALERAVARSSELSVEAQAAQLNVERIVAETEGSQARDLARRLEAAEARFEEKLASLTAAGRKTVAAGTATMLAKQGVDVGGGVALDAGAVDGALANLSIEQRIAVKAELMRAGLLG
jgi:hypothetical protein